MPSLYPTDPAPAPRPSRIPPGLPSWAASTVAIIGGLGGLLTAWQSFESGQNTQRAAYEALRRADSEKAARIAELAQGQLELRAWVTELSARLDQRADSAERAIRKVAKPKTTPMPPPAPPPPAPPPPPEVTPSVPLPSFDELELER